jgi:hypothetical protein
MTVKAHAQCQTMSECQASDSRPTFRHSDIPTFRHSDIPTFRHSDIPTFPTGVLSEQKKTGMVLNGASNGAHGAVTIHQSHIGSEGTPPQARHSPPKWHSCQATHTDTHNL